jgi:hypothetical protein
MGSLTVELLQDALNGAGAAAAAHGDFELVVVLRHGVVKYGAVVGCSAMECSGVRG